MIIFTSSCSPIIYEINFMKKFIHQRRTFYAMTQSVVVGRNFQWKIVIKYFFCSPESDVTMQIDCSARRDYVSFLHKMLITLDKMSFPMRLNS